MAARRPVSAGLFPVHLEPEPRSSAATCCRCCRCCRCSARRRLSPRCSSLRYIRLAPQRRNAVIVALTLLAIGPPAYSSIAFNANAAKVWTTEQAYQWILRSIPKGSKVTLESRQILLPDRLPADLPDAIAAEPAGALRRERRRVPGRLVPVYGPYFDAAKAGRRSIRRNTREYLQHLQPDRRDRALHALGGPSRPGAAHPQDQAGGLLTAESRKPGAGSRKPEAGSRKPGAGSREPGARSREPEAGSREPEAGSREPGAGSREPGAGSRKPDAGS